MLQMTTRKLAWIFHKIGLFNDLESFRIIDEILKSKKCQLSPKKEDGGFNCCNPSNDPRLDNLIKINRYCDPISKMPKYSDEFAQYLFSP